MIVALIILGCIIIAQFGLIWSLVNRLLVQAKVPPIELPKFRKTMDAEPEPKPETRRKVFSIPIAD